MYLTLFFVRIIATTQHTIMKTKHAQAYRFVRYVLSAFCLMIMLVPLPSYGADTGTVKGKITDKADGEGVFGASVTIPGTTLGTATDMNGNFTLQNVPAKQQKVSISIIGYAPASQVVTVTSGQTTVVNLKIGQTTVMASEVIVGASLYKQDRLDVPVTVNVVTQEQIEQEPNPTLDRVIEDVPGVVVNRAGGQTTSTVQIRGSNTYQGGAIGTRVQGFYDGFPLNTPETGEVVWSSVNMNAADKVEILKGAAATLYGSGAMGGVINASGHLPEKLEAKAGFNGGFYDAPPSSDQSDYRKPAGTTPVSIGTPWFWNSYVGLGNKSGKLNYSLLYTHSNDDGYRQNAQSDLNDIKLKARYDIDSKQYIQLSSFYNETNGGYATTWPYNVTTIGPNGPIFLAVPGPLKAYDVLSVYQDDIIKRTNALVGVNYVNLLSDKLSLDTRLYYTHNSTTIDYNPAGPANPQQLIFYTNYGPLIPYSRAIGEFNETSSNRYGAGAKIDWRASENHRLLFGVDGNIVDVQSTQYTATKPVYNTLSPIQENNAAAFVQDEWKIAEKLTALLSLRYDWSGIDANEVTYVDYVNPVITGFGPSAIVSYATKTVPVTNSSVEAFSPRIALNYKTTDDMSLRASWGRSFRAPTLAERFIRDAGFLVGVPNPDLNKETMTAYEVGMFNQISDKVSLDIAGFLDDYDNLIESVTVTNAAYKQYFTYKNITTARIWGIETSLNIKPCYEWNLNLAYTYMNAKNTSYTKSLNKTLDQNPDPEWLPMRPENTASANVTWRPTKQFEWYVNGRYLGKYKAVNFYTNPEGTNYPGDFIVFDTGLKYKAGENAILSLLCRNIGNVQYEEAEWFRAPGRSYVAGVDFTF
jgi:iron complex outermembrane recepter protein